MLHIQNEIEYDEGYSLETIKEVNLDYLDKNKVILLKMRFDGIVWNKFVYDDFRIVTLTRTDNSNWVVKESGYW